MSDDVIVDEATEAESSTETAPAEKAAPVDKTAKGAEPVADAPRRPWPTIALAVVALAALVAAIVFGLKWYSASGELSDNARAADLQQQAVQTARDYTTRSLTYDYRNLDGFFSGVEDGTTDALRDRFESVREPLSSIMTQSQVVATGNVLAASVDSEQNGEYKVTVYATQQTQNLQQPDPGDVPNLLTVTATNTDGQWLVSDYGPKSAE